MRFVSVVPDNLSVPALNPANDIISARVSLRIGASSYTPLQRVGHAIRLSHSVSASYAIIFAA